MSRKKKPIPIAPTLKKMDVSQEVSLPLRSYMVVNATIHRIKKASSKRFTQKKDEDKQVVTVTRTA